MNEGNPFKYTDGSTDWVVVIVIALIAAAVFGFININSDDGEINCPSGYTDQC